MLMHRVLRKLYWLSYRFFWGVLFGNLIYPIRERLRRRPARAFKEALLRTTPAEMAPLVHCLERDGIAVLPGFVQAEELHRLQDSFESMHETIKSASNGPQHWFAPARYGTYEEYVYRDRTTSATYTYHPFQYSQPLLEIAVNDFLRGIIARYFGKPFMLSEANAARYYPMPPVDFLSWRWHHDGLGKRVNCMVLLTDVTEHDQYMSYLKGSHRHIHRYCDHGGTSRFTNEDLKKYPPYERLDCTGTAGTIFIFDSNGIHRGNRSMGAHRDTLITCYCGGRNITKLVVRKEFYEALTIGQREFLRRNPRLDFQAGETAVHEHAPHYVGVP